MSERAAPESIDHLILTRFSVRFTTDQAPATDGWLVYRWAFFREAAAASMARQTVRDVKWLVFFDADSPEWLREEVGMLAPGLFIPIWLDEIWSLSAIRRVVRQHTSAPTLVTTRFDSDDALGREFVEMIHQCVRGNEGRYINLMRGVQVDRQGRVFQCDELRNAFLSFVESRIEGHPPMTVFRDYRHGHARKYASVVNVVGKPSWMQVVHGGNLANYIRGQRINPRSVEPLFDIDLTYRTEVSRGTLVREWVQSVWSSPW